MTGTGGDGSEVLRGRAEMEVKVDGWVGMETKSAGTGGDGCDVCPCAGLYLLSLAICISVRVQSSASAAKASSHVETAANANENKVNIHMCCFLLSRRR